ncbi:hypothetical protein [Streptomyces hainanensis]|uniref:Integral membrane protein n=1 Tax=Streptomyces hainanensis TaxID=402648 RepID=A0A4R4TID1_9ACTN|nr:hypothetical protein [Streptomyces hainanensis]TDC77568.1 hypothetical protein E1283_07095 [Streptomyces hainanensis]
MTDRRRASDRPDGPGEEHNPFAPPPEGAPDRPWQPRHLDGEGQDGGRRGDGDRGEDRDTNGRQDDQRQRWGSQWSSRQPRRGSGRWGEPSGGQDGGSGGGPAGPGRWDPSDPAQRHARYAMLAGMWGVLTAALGWEWLALLLGSLALYWGISSLRGGPRQSPEARDRRVAALQGGTPAPAPAPEPGPSGQAPAGAAKARQGSSPGRASAISGVVLAGVALLLVGASYTLQLVYKDYFDCVNDALTTPSRASCETLLPSELRPYFGEPG